MSPRKVSQREQMGTVGKQILGDGGEKRASDEGNWRKRKRPEAASVADELTWGHPGRNNSKGGQVTKTRHHTEKAEKKKTTTDIDSGRSTGTGE